MKINKIPSHSLKYLHIILLFLSGVLVFSICIAHIDETVNLIAWDELGYWGNAAYLAGYDWSSVVSANAGYYSYGYSLILSIIIHFFMENGIAYQVAVLLNAVMMTAVMYIAYIVGLYYAGRENRITVLTAALAVTLYANNITQAKMAWSECTIIFLYWLLILLFMSLQNQYKKYKLMLINLICIYLFFVHNRMIAVLIACIVIDLLIFSFQKESRIFIFVSLILDVLLIIGGIRLQSFIKVSVYASANDRILANTTASLVPDTINKLNLKGIIEMCKCFLCRFFYWGCTTYLMSFVFFKTAIKKLYYQLKNKKIDFTLMFILLSTLATFGLLSITLSQQGSYQALLYGRYPDAILGPVYMLGFLYFLTDTNQKQSSLWRELLIYQSILLILYKVVRSIVISRDYFVANCNVDFYDYWIGTAKGGYDLARPILIAFSVFIIMMGARYIKAHNSVSANIILICLLCLYIHTKYNVSEKVFNITFTNYEDLTEFNQTAALICKDSSSIGFYHDDNWRCTPLEMWLQFEMYDKSIVDLKTIDNAAVEYLFVPRVLNADGIYVTSTEIKGELIREDKYIALYKMK